MRDQPVKELRMTLELVKPDAERCAEARRRAKALLQSFLMGEVTTDEILKLASETRH